MEEKIVNYTCMFITAEPGMYGKPEYRVHRIMENGVDDPTPWTYRYRESAISYIAAHTFED